MYCEFVIKLYKAGFSMKLTVAMQDSFVHKWRFWLWHYEAMEEQR